MRKESPAARQRRVEDAFTMKVTILEAWASSGLPDGAVVPDTHAALRRWQGPDGSIETWSDPLVDRPRVGKYPDLTARYLKAIEKIGARQAKARSRNPTDSDVAALNLENDALRCQNADLLGRVDLHQRRITMLENCIQAYGKPIP